MLITAAIALAAHFGAFGEFASSMAIYIAPVVAFVATPALAVITKGKFYLARKPRAQWKNLSSITCSICEHPFEPEDMAWCPAYSAPICSLCCSLDSRCHDLCKPKARLKYQAAQAAASILPEEIIEKLSTRLGRYAITATTSIAAIGITLWLIAERASRASPETTTIVNDIALAVFFVFSIVAGIAAWFFVLAHDSRVVAEEESRRQNTALLKEIAAHEKTDAALQKAKETAEAANQAKSRYVVGLSHELRTPLNAVLGYAQILERDDTIPQPRQSAIKVIKRSAEHLSGLIDGLLDISKIEAGRLQVYPGEVNIHDFLEQIADMFRPQAQAKGLEFTFSLSTNFPRHVRIDEKRMRQILVNLISNAIKFTDAGKITFTAEYRSQVATFTISDTGRGISQEHLPHIFEPFQRGEAEQIRPMPGLGLGLTITRLLTHMLGGEILVSSTRDKGTRFQVRLGLPVVNRADPDTQKAEEKRITGYQGRPRTIMVVDDNADHRDLMLEVLTPLEFIVLMAGSGPECLTLIEGTMPDLFFVDISMPGMSGWKLVEKLREGGTTAPIIMLSANIGDGAPSGQSDAGHSDAIAKPFALKQLIDKLETHLKLSWTYENDATEAAPADGAVQIASPGQQHVEELIQLGEIGYVRGIEAKLAELERNEANLPFTTPLRAYVQAFDLTGFARFLETYRDEISQ